MNEHPSLLLRRQQGRFSGLVALAVIVALAITQIFRDVTWSIKSGASKRKTISFDSDQVSDSHYLRNATFQNDSFSSPSDAVDGLSTSAQEKQEFMHHDDKEDADCAQTFCKQTNSNKVLNYPPSYNESSRLLRIVHVWSPFAVRRKENNPYYPLDLTQYVTVQSMIRAKEYVTSGGVTMHENDNFHRHSENIYVTTHCAIMQEDLQLLFPDTDVQAIATVDSSEPFKEDAREYDMESHANYNVKEEEHTRLLSGHAEPQKVVGDDEQLDSIVSSLSSLCDGKIVLTRSTATEYPTMEPTKSLPFLQDIIQGSLDKTNTNLLVTDSSTSTSFDYMIYTNADIGLTQDFYEQVATALRQPQPHPNAGLVINMSPTKTSSTPNIAEYSGTKLLSKSSPYHSWPWDAMTIDRKTIRNSRLTDLKEIDKILQRRKSRQTWGPHPGTDCFVMHKTVIELIQFHNLFLGHPPTARTLKFLLLDHLIHSFQRLPSKASLTFHLGDDRQWNKNSKRMNLTDSQVTLVQACEHSNVRDMRGVSAKEVRSSSKWTPHILQNTINCGEIFQEREWYDERNGRTVRIPNYVKPGYEDRYSRFYAFRKPYKKPKKKRKKKRKKKPNSRGQEQSGSDKERSHDAHELIPKKKFNDLIISNQNGKLVYKEIEEG